MCVVFFSHFSRRHHVRSIVIRDEFFFKSFVEFSFIFTFAGNKNLQPTVSDNGFTYLYLFFYRYNFVERAKVKSLKHLLNFTAYYFTIIVAQLYRMQRSFHRNGPYKIRGR